MIKVNPKLETPTLKTDFIKRETETFVSFLKLAWQMLVWRYVFLKNEAFSQQPTMAKISKVCFYI